MPKMTRQTKAQRRVVRQIQRLVQQHGYYPPSFCKVKMIRCCSPNGDSILNAFNEALALTTYGVFATNGHWGETLPWTGFTATFLRQLLEGAKRFVAEINEELAKSTKTK